MRSLGFMLGMVSDDADGGVVGDLLTMECHR